MSQDIFSVKLYNDFDNDFDEAIIRDVVSVSYCYVTKRGVRLTGSRRLFVVVVRIKN